MNNRNTEKLYTALENTPPKTESFYEEIHPDSWDDARALSKKLNWWTFRGHADASWPLLTTLERSADRQEFLFTFLARQESYILRDFKRRAHHYMINSPSDDNHLEWLALIQHYGGPTRLLCNEAIGKSSLPSLVLVGEPERLSERLAAQQGMFLFPRNIEKSFAENLVETFDQEISVFSAVTPKPYKRDTQFTTILNMPAVMKIVLHRKIHKTVLSDLRRMNITSATLFSGLDGYARSLHYHLSTFQRGDDFSKPMKEDERKT